MTARRSHPFVVALAATLAAGAVAAPAAVARPAMDPSAGDPTPDARRPAVQTVDAGFDWGATAIGAGGGAIVIAVAVGGFAYSSREHGGIL